MLTRPSSTPFMKLTVATLYDVYTTHTHYTSDKTLRKKLLDTVLVIYLDAIEHKTLGFGQRASLHIMYYILDT